MRTTLRIDDELLRQLKEQAHRENVSLTRLVNRTLRAGMQQSRRSGRRPAYREQTYSMGEPQLNLDRALALAADLEDEEILRKLALRK
ncbi:MAG: hypothetical protein R3202_08705 [Candidatus Competibacterales bacterium]|nr:hypothetical protein [Candidatus Competibacterales bacterium]